MVVIAAALYLPEHVTMMARRAWFYYAGEDEESGEMVGSLKGGDDQVMDLLGRL